MKLLLIFLLFCTSAFAKEEPHFDLPKKDPKEQCKEVERVINECEKHIERNGKIYKCGNVYIVSYEFYEDLDLHPYSSYEGYVPFLIMDEYGNFIASNLSYDIAFIRNLQDNALFEDNGKKIDKKNILYLKNSNCNITEVWLTR